MTTPTAPSAREVAKHLDRRRMRRRLVFWLALLALVVAFALYARCGNGFGLGGAGAGAGAGGGGSAAPATAGACSIRVSAAGITVDGAAKTADEAIAACKARPVTVLVTGDAKQGEWETLQRGFDAAHTQYKVEKPH